MILVAYMDSIPVGFKVGYDRDNDGTFYSWMGSVLPRYRRLGIAQALTQKQETWVKGRGYSAIRFKTRRCHKAMIAFGEKSGFTLTKEIPKIPDDETRLLYEKPLGGA